MLCRRRELAGHLVTNPELQVPDPRMAELQCGFALHSSQAREEVRVPLPFEAVYNADCSSYDLPADVFVEGEVRPVRTKKAKTAPKNTEAANNKRSFSNTGLDVGHCSKRHRIC